MLKGEYDYILYSFNRVGRGVPGEPLADDNFDASNIITGVPMILVKQLAAKRWKLERLELALLGHF